jgi:histone deacetylase 1/2
MQETNWTSVFAPTLRYISLRVILALAAHHDYEIKKMNVVTAFLNANVVSEIYMDQTQGFRKTTKDREKLVCKLKKALYGIREAPRAWNFLLSEWLSSIGYKQSKVDPAVYTILHNCLLYILAVYVDDCILVGKQGPFILTFKKNFSSYFQIEDLGSSSWLLGCRIERDRPNCILTIDQGKYITDILEEFDMTTAKIADTPMAAKQSKDTSTSEPLDKKIFPFAKLIGKLLYCSNCTRPDITMAVNYLSRHMASAIVRH